MLSVHEGRKFIWSSRRNNFRNFKALIARGENLKINLKNKLTTRDSRVVERKNTTIEKPEEASIL